jgi:predicted acetyltransferase
MRVALTTVQECADAATFFANTWPMYLHEISGFDTDFYTLDYLGRWHPDLVGHWTAPVTPPENLREPRSDADAGQPFQRSLVIDRDDDPAGFVCVGAAPFKYMPDDVDYVLCELFLTHPHRGTGVAEAAVELLLARYPGSWFLRAIHDNTRAIRFWRCVLPRMPVHRLEEGRDGSDVVWRFVSAPGRP